MVRHAGDHDRDPATVEAGQCFPGPSHAGCVPHGVPVLGEALDEIGARLGTERDDEVVGLHPLSTDRRRTVARVDLLDVAEDEVSTASVETCPEATSVGEVA